MNLHQLVDRSAQSISTYKVNRIINDINPRLEVDAETEMLMEVVLCLLDSATGHAGSTYVRVAAKTFHNIVLMQIKYSDPRYENEIEKALEGIKELAQSLGGCLYVTRGGKKETTISLTFMSQHVFAIA